MHVSFLLLKIANRLCLLFTIKLLYMFEWHFDELQFPNTGQRILAFFAQRRLKLVITVSVFWEPCDAIAMWLAQTDEEFKIRRWGVHFNSIDHRYYQPIELLLHISQLFSRRRVKRHTLCHCITVALLISLFDYTIRASMIHAKLPQFGYYRSYNDFY